ncbi:hypothetical protein [Campylobacter mucosalis]|uniref:hypothetical protein n=1 Tax=Campylobacter mucosalis TaxID=202 RepID=UPI0004D7E63E|nr:hypothetical protein [Campylobacter mucosalis]KEA46681.1 hypothetical protein CR66_02385 [Campylobacter mucosalis]QKF62793.1 hypothetical protein CMCT_0645 [Campylobacter mucosalis]
MKFTKVFSVATAVALCVSGANASELSFFGGVQNSKDISANNDSKKAPFYELAFKVNPKEMGFVSNLKLKYQDNKGMKFYDMEGVFGWQFGDTEGMGAFKILPAGIGYRYMKFSDKQVTSGSYELFDSTGSLYYKGGVEYQKDNLLTDKLSLNAGVYYQAALYTGTWAKDRDTYNLGTGSSSELKYKPKGFEAEVGLDYNFTPNFAVGIKAGYSKISDSAYTDGTKIYLSDGFNLSAGLKYKF